jgi:cytochrome bd-type quinol oxidase subunit 1
MQYPLWEVPVLGGGMVIAIVATVHVVVAHFAVGAGLFTAVTEYRAYKYNKPVLLRFLKDFSHYLVLVSFVFGALTGVGIWFSISLASPEATSALIHLFVWGWAIEWVFFFVEIAAGYVYYYNWDKMDRKTHLTVAWIYAISAYMSLVVINGILTFMLTPGEWLQSGNFWDAFFNPTYWPSLALRTISCMSLAAIFVAVAANFAKGYTREERHEIITEGGRWLIPLIIMIPVSAWYIFMLPEPSQDMVKGGAIAMTLMFGFGLVMSTLIGFYAYVGLILKKRYVNMETALLLGLIAFISTASMEFVREGVRKPFVIYDYMYSNAILVSNVDELNQTGTLEWAPWASLAVAKTTENVPMEARGEILFRVQCNRCHTLDGVNGIKPLIKNWSRNSISHSLETLHEEQFFMPPFIGTQEEMEKLTDYLETLSKPEPEVSLHQ